MQICTYSVHPMLSIYFARLCIAHDGGCRGCCHNLPLLIEWPRPDQERGNRLTMSDLHTLNTTANPPKTESIPIQMSQNWHEYVGDVLEKPRPCLQGVQLLRICIDCFPIGLSLLPQDCSKICLVTSVMRRSKENEARCLSQAQTSRY